MDRPLDRLDDQPMEVCVRKIGTPDDELQMFSDRVAELIRNGEPIKLYPGCGNTAARTFLNLDIGCNMKEDDPRWENHELFFFPFADVPWPIPDNCVDYIFHEDFIEHINQKQQVCFLAECLRVMKPGSWHRVNTPCLAESMRRHSHFELGSRGVYTGEWTKWGHVSVFTRQSLSEMARMVGYRDIAFNQRNQGVSPHKFTDCRPGPDRDEIFGNIFADLLK